MLKAKKIKLAKTLTVLIVSIFSVFVFLMNVMFGDRLKDETHAFARFVGKFTPHVALGLDLKGGSQLVLSVNLDRLIMEKYSSVSKELKEALWNERVAYGGMVENVEGIALKKSDFKELDASKVKEIVDKHRLGLVVEKKKDDLLLSFSSAEMSSLRLGVMERVMKTIRSRIDEAGTKEIVIQRVGDSGVLVQVPGVENPEQIKRLLGRVASLTFHLLSDDEPFANAPFAHVPPDCVAMQDYGSNGNWFKVKRYASLNGSSLVDARVTNENMKMGISFKLNSAGARKFADITEANVGKPLAIVLDDKVLTAPTINTPILGGSGVISGSFTYEDAQEIASLLRAGSLPAPLDVVEERTIGPSVGLRSVKSAVVAGLIAVSGITLFMVVRYGLLGAVASVGILLNLTTAVTMIAIFGISLTLPGMAALLLTLGMSIDANVLIYERMRDEIQNGEKERERIVKNGFKGSWTGILDSNITTFLAAITMMAFGSGFIRGFAISLITGIACSLFSAITFTKLVIEWLFIDKRFPINLKGSGKVARR